MSTCYDHWLWPGITAECDNCGRKHGIYVCKKCGMQWCQRCMEIYIRESRPSKNPLPLPDNYRHPLSESGLVRDTTGKLWLLQSGKFIDAKPPF